MRRLSLQRLALSASIWLAIGADVHAQSVIPGPGANGGGGPTLRAAGQTPPQQVTGELIGIICPASPSILGSDLQARCDEIAVGIIGGGDISGGLAGLQGMAAEENSAVQTTEVDASAAQTDELRERLEQRRKEDEEKESAFNVTVDGRRLTFRVSAEDEKELIGEGTHERIIVNVARFDERAQDKAVRS